LIVSGTDCQQRWPCAKVTVNQQIVYDGNVVDLKEISYRSSAKPNQKKCIIDIEYYNKTDQDTIVDATGTIISNQSLTIKELWVNGVDIIKTKTIHQGIGCYTMSLTLDKKQYFIQHGIDLSPSTNTQMFENGVWHIELALPLLSTLTGKFNYSEPCEQVDVLNIVEKLHAQLLVCQTLENQSRLGNQNDC